MTTYTIYEDTVLTTNHNISSAGATIGYVRDGATSHRHMDIDASVRSGEYFLTLATILDHISDNPEMQQIIRDLMYLQKNYKIVKKEK